MKELQDVQNLGLRLREDEMKDKDDLKTKIDDLKNKIAVMTTENDQEKAVLMKRLPRTPNNLLVKCECG